MLYLYRGETKKNALAGWKNWLQVDSPNPPAACVLCLRLAAAGHVADNAQPVGAP